MPPMLPAAACHVTLCLQRPNADDHRPVTVAMAVWPDRVLASIPPSFHSSLFHSSPSSTPLSTVASFRSFFLLSLLSLRLFTPPSFHPASPLYPSPPSVPFFPPLSTQTAVPVDSQLLTATRKSLRWTLPGSCAGCRSSSRGWAVDTPLCDESVMKPTPPQDT